MENNDKRLNIKEVRAFIFGLIDSMSEEEMRQLLKDLEARENKERRKYSRKDFFRIIDCTVEDRHYRDLK